MKVSHTFMAWALVLLSQQVANGQWLSDWIDFGGHQYRVTAALDWVAADALAGSVGGHLVTINDATENVWVLDNLMPFATDQTQGLWIGLFQPDGSPEPDGGWQWVNGDALSYTNWQSPNPNNNTVFGNENAGNMWGSTGGNGVPGTWNDYNANHWVLPAVVELDQAVPAVSEWGFVAMSLLMVTAGTLVYARRRPIQA